MTTTTTTTTTGHTLTVDTARGWLRVAGDIETMDRIPDAELRGAALAAGCLWTGEYVDETTYRVTPLVHWIDVITTGPAREARAQLESLRATDTAGVYFYRRGGEEPQYDENTGDVTNGLGRDDIDWSGFESAPNEEEKS